MCHTNDEQTTRQQSMDQLTKQLAELEQTLHMQEKRTERMKRTFIEYNQAFTEARANVQSLLNKLKRFVKHVKAPAAYLLGRRNIKQLYSKSYKIKNALNTLKPYKFHLYDLGFTAKALADLENLQFETDDPYIQRAIAWELALWYANQTTVDGARQALDYLRVVTVGEKDENLQRRAAIIQAECYDRVGQIEAGKKVIHDRLAVEQHPDLLLARANLETSMNSRLMWINKAMAMYDLQPISFTETDERAVTYEDLKTEPLAQEIIDGPKVSVILPAYNSETGIRVAIESILSQTWKNIELIIVDDCSTDRTKEVIQQYMRTDRRIRLFSTRENSGPYVARNIALREATGEFVTVNDADDWSHAEKIATQVKHLLNDREAVANTSEHARLTEGLKLYRRGTPGTYIFSNMSSLMFRRKPVMEKLGFWDSVRFAADGEFKRRLLHVFGKERVVDLQTGPLSLPRQSVSSLTGSSAFGYSGFFMGARKEYVESFTFYHERADDLYYEFPQRNRPFPVPEPMWPRREEKPTGRRHFDVVIGTDYRLQTSDLQTIIEMIDIHKQQGLRTGLVQISRYDLQKRNQPFNQKIRDVIDGRDVQMLVYGETITCDLLIVHHPSILQEKQHYLPNVEPKTVSVIIDVLPVKNGTRVYEMRRCARHLDEYVGKRGNWYPYDDEIRSTLLNKHQRELKSIKLVSENWTKNSRLDLAVYRDRLADWLIEDHPNQMRVEEGDDENETCQTEDS